MNSQQVFDYLFKGFMMLMGTGALGLLYNIANKIGKWEEWKDTTEKQLEALGKMSQESTSTIARILGWFESQDKAVPKRKART